MSTLPGYEKKFADFMRLCAESKAKCLRITTTCPWSLGDTHEELIESLTRFA
jgi:hypothetical protein